MIVVEIHVFGSIVSTIPLLLVHFSLMRHNVSALNCGLTFLLSNTHFPFNLSNVCLVLLMKARSPSLTSFCPTAKVSAKYCGSLMLG